MSKKKVVCIGLTGTMGSGKSSVLRKVQQMGFPVIDCDSINRNLLMKHAQGYEKIVATFGSVMLDSMENIDVKKMGTYIFSDSDKKKQVEAILHPLIQEQLCNWIQTQEGIVLVEVPLLFEVSWQHLFDEVWVVACEEAIALKRLHMYRHIDEEEAKKRIQQQLAQEEKIQKADAVFWNHGNLSHLYEQVEKEMQRLRGKLYE